MSDHTHSRHNGHAHDDLRPADGDTGLRVHWGESVRRACTAWLHKRGLLATQIDQRFANSTHRGGQVSRKIHRTKEDHP